MNNYKLVTVYKRGNILEGKIFSSKRYGDFEVLEYLGSCRYSIKFIKA